MASKEIQDVSDFDGKGEIYQRVLTLLNEAVDILRSPCMSSCHSIKTATVGSVRILLIECNSFFAETCSS